VRRYFSNFYTVFFIVILCSASALILSVMATSIRARQEKAKQLDLAKEQLEAARIYSYKGHFLVEKDGEYIPAVYDAAKGILVPGEGKATPDQIYAVASKRLIPRLTDAKGQVQTFKEAGIDQEEYIQDNLVKGYARLKEKLVYLIMPNKEGEDKEKPVGYVLPVAGFGLWGPIYGYIALEENADTVVGVTWRAPSETPGVGAIIEAPYWQAQFHGKKIFLPGPGGKTNFETAPLGITVVKGKVKDVYGDSPRAQTAVDGISGATLTGDGVTAAYKDSLGPYRPFLVKRADGKKP